MIPSLSSFLYLKFYTFFMSLGGGSNQSQELFGYILIISSVRVLYILLPKPLSKEDLFKITASSIS